MKPCGEGRIRTQTQDSWDKKWPQNSFNGWVFLKYPKKTKTPKQEPRIQIQDYKEAHTQKKKRAHSIGDDNKYTHGNERKGNRWEIQQQQIKNNETGEVKLETRDKRLPK